MDVALIHEVLLDAVLAAVRSDVTERRVRALFHHVTELPRELQLAAAVHARRFDE